MTRNFNLSAKLEAALRVAVCANPKCRKGPLSEIGVEYDHINLYAVSKDSSADNCQLLCPECHKRKTFGSKATTAGSDIGNAAKVKRLRGETGQNRVKAKIANRGFDKRLKKKFNGKVEVRT